MDRRLISPKRDRRHLGGEPNIHGHLVSGLPSRIPDLARSPCTPCLGGIRLLSAPVSDPGLGRKAPPGAFCCTCRRFCYDLLYLQAPFCCACTRLFEFLLYLQALFCCTYRRLFAVPARAFGHGSAALAFTHENENKTGGARLPRILPTLAGRPSAAHVPALSASRTRRWRPRLARSVSVRPGRPRQGTETEPGRTGPLARIGHALRHRIDVRASAGRIRPSGLLAEKYMAVVRPSVRSLDGQYSSGILPV